jgi:hypothetical protein
LISATPEEAFLADLICAVHHPNIEMRAAAGASFAEQVSPSESTDCVILGYL